MDRVQVTLAFGVQIHCAKGAVFADRLEDLWYYLRRIMGQDTSRVRMGQGISLVSSNDITRTFANPTLSKIGINSPRVLSSLALEINGGQILRYQGILQFDLYFNSLLPYVSGVDISIPGTPTPPPPTPSGIGYWGIGETFIVS
jgi:hypothetical protein